MKKNYIKTTSNHLLILNSRRQQATITMVINFRVMTQQIPTIYRKVMMLELRFKKKLIENIFGINSAILFMQIFKHNSHVSLQFEFMSDCNKNCIKKNLHKNILFAILFLNTFFSFSSENKLHGIILYPFSKLIENSEEEKSTSFQRYILHFLF